MNFLKKATFILGMAMSTFVVSPVMADDNLLSAVKAVPQLNANCSASVIYSDRDKKSGKVETILLTAKHCVEGSEKSQMFVEFYNFQDTNIVKKDKYMAHVLGTSYKADIALVKLDDSQTIIEPVNKIADEGFIPQMGSDTVAIGYPFGLGLTFTEGKFMHTLELDWPEPGKLYYRATPDIGPGNSGGALMYKKGDGTYVQIGVSDAVIPGFTFMGLYVPLNEIRDYLKIAYPKAIGIDAEAQKTGTTRTAQ